MDVFVELTTDRMRNKRSPPPPWNIQPYLVPWSRLSLCHHIHTPPTATVRRHLDPLGLSTTTILNAKDTTTKQQIVMSQILPPRYNNEGDKKKKNNSHGDNEFDHIHVLIADVIRGIRSTWGANTDPLWYDLIPYNDTGHRCCPVHSSKTG